MTPNNTLEILIKLGVIGKEDAAAVQDLLQETGKSTDDLSKKTKAAAGASQEHNEHLHESRLLFNELNRIVPGLGHLLHAAFAGPVGPAIALGCGAGYCATIRKNVCQGRDDDRALHLYRAALERTLKAKVRREECAENPF